MAQLSRHLRSTLTLHDGVVMPMFGLGLYKTDAGENAADVAIKHGYRLLDTAQAYGNEDGVGRAVKKCGIPRNELFVVTKQLNHGKEKCVKEFRESLEKLNIGSVDLFLLHHPMHGKIIETYDAMQEFKKEGLVRSVGVSNFNVHHLEALEAAGRPLPSVNQIELHPFHRLEPLVEYCRTKNITVMGYSPLARMKHVDDPLVKELAVKYKKTVAQIMIRWSLQKGYITIPKSSDPERIVQNADVFDFVLADQEMDRLDKSPTQSCTNWTPLEAPWIG